MAYRRKVNTTKLDIIQVATKIFFEKGYSETSARKICDELDISTGNLTYYFPTKEHILAVMVDMLCEFQWEVMQNWVEEGKTSLLAICLELTAMAAMCEESEIAKDFYLSVYSHPMTLEIIRKNDVDRAKQVFAEYCLDWTEDQFKEAETLVSGIEYATMMTTESSSSLEMRIAGALNGILLLYNVPEELRRVKIEKVLSIDYREVGRRILREFIAYTEKTTEQAIEELLKNRRSHRET